MQRWDMEGWQAGAKCTSSRQLSQVKKKMGDTQLCVSPIGLFLENALFYRFSDLFNDLGRSHHEDFSTVNISGPIQVNISF